MNAPQFASSRAPAAGLPYHATRSRNENGGQIKSLGIHDKCTPQSVIAATIRNGIPSCDRFRGKIDTEVIAPYDDSPEVNKVCRSDILMATVSGSCGVRVVDHGMPTVDCFSGLNGIPVDEAIKFVGIATFTGIGEGRDDTKDNVAACVLAGTATVINNSDQTLQPFDRVMASEYSYHVVVDDEILPGVNEVGHYEKQFRAATYRIIYTNVTTLLQMIRFEMKALYRRLSDQDDWESIELQIKQSLDAMYIRARMPVYVYAFVYFAHLMFLDLEEDADMKVLSKIWDLWLEFQRTEKNKYDEALDKGFDQTDENYHIREFPDYAKDKRKFRRVVGETLNFAMMGLQALQHDYIAARDMGICLSLAEPGKEWDVFLRAG